MHKQKGKQGTARLRQVRPRRFHFIDVLEKRVLLSTIYVDQNAPTGTHNGQSWSAAYTDIQTAINAAVSGDAIHVADGTYDSTLTLKSGVSLLGGYAGYGASNPDARGFSTIMSGAQSLNPIMTGDNLASGTTIDGFGITGARSNSGGGLYLTNSTLSISNCNFYSDYSSNRGGAIEAVESTLTCTSCTFTSNSAYQDGGAITFDDSPLDLTLTSCTFSSNFTTGTSDGNGYGGAVEVGSTGGPNDSANLTNCSFSSNTAAYYGGGLDVEGKVSLNVSGCTFTSNSVSSTTSTPEGGAVWLGTYQAPARPQFLNCSFTSNTSKTGDGGAVYSNVASPEFSGCTFANNSAYIGGGLYDNQDSVSLTNCIFRANSAVGSGGGIYVSEGSTSPTVILTQSLFIANTASGDDAIYVSTINCFVTNCTFVANSSLLGTGDVVHLSATSGAMTNCIVWDDNVPLHTAVTASSSVPVTYCDIEYGFTGTGNVSVDPRFIDLDGADNILGTSDDNARLSSVSPVADLGNNTVSPLAGITTDLAGQPRYANIPTQPDGGVTGGSGGNTIIDMGAYEAQSALAADAGTSYKVMAGKSIILNGYASSTVAGALTYAWDFNGDGKYDDATGANPTFTASASAGGQTVQVKLQIHDANNRTATSTATISIVPTIIYVDDSSPVAGNGTSWSNAYRDLAAALNAAVDGSELHVAAGTYKPTTTTDRTKSFVVGNGMTLLGGYAGYGASNPDARNPSTYVTTLSADIGTSNNTSDNSYRVLLATYDTQLATLDGFTITGSNSTINSDPTAQGGGLLAEQSNLTINNCTFQNNSAENGGAIYTYYGNLTLTNSTFSGNSAFNSGGAVQALYTPAQISNCSFTNNSITGSFGQGGAVVLQVTIGQTQTVSQCTFTGDTAPTAGALDVTAIGGAGLTVSDCTFLRNKSTGFQAAAGAVESSGATFIGCIFEGNTTTGYGGAFDAESKASSLVNCIFVGNTASTTGGGALYINFSGTSVTNCTIANNAALGSLSGGGIYAKTAFTLANDILWNNTATNGSQIFLATGGSTTVTNSDVQGGYTGTTNLNSDPKFLRNPAIGTDNTWGTTDDDYGNLRLASGSPAIDAGSNASVPSGTTTDLDGNPRIVDTPTVHDPGAIVDTGAYETVAPLALITAAYLSTSSTPSISFTFNNVLATSSISTTDVTINTMLSNGSLGASIAAIGWSYSPSTKTLTFTLPTSIADANYHAVIPMNSLNGVAGDSLSADSPLDFFLLSADANHDRTVNALDFNALATNYGKPGTFSQGDFDYSGTVDSNDFALLASRYGTVLAPPAGSAQPAVTLATSLSSSSVNLFADEPIAASDVDDDLLN